MIWIPKMTIKFNNPYERQPSNEAISIAKLMAQIDFEYGDCFGFKFGGDGDNGEFLAGLLDILIEAGYITYSSDPNRYDYYEPKEKI